MLHLAFPLLPFVVQDKLKCRSPKGSSPTSHFTILSRLRTSSSLFPFFGRRCRRRLSGFNPVSHSDGLGGSREKSKRKEEPNFAIKSSSARPSYPDKHTRTCLQYSNRLGSIYQWAPLISRQGSLSSLHFLRESPGNFRTRRRLSPSLPLPPSVRKTRCLLPPSNPLPPPRTPGRKKEREKASQKNLSPMRKMRFFLHRQQKEGAPSTYTRLRVGGRTGYFTGEANVILESVADIRVNVLLSFRRTKRRGYKS